MAHKKGQGSTKNGRDSNPQFRGIKLYGGEAAKAGSIIVRQCGTVWKPGYLVYMGKDYSLMAKAPGKVVFKSGHVHIVPSDPSVPQYAAVVG
ncbi:MAG: ribosomal protein [Planctomycetota bacterium]